MSIVKVDSIRWEEYGQEDRGESPFYWLNRIAVGDLGVFRYVDADAHDPEGWEVFFGPIVEIGIVDREHAVITALCQDGCCRRFQDYEMWGESLEQYEQRLRDGVPISTDHSIV